MDISYIRCAIQVALLGHTSSNLRAVVVKIDGNKINLLFFYDSIPSEDEIELANLTETEFMADFPFSVKIDFEIIHLPQPNPIPNSGIFAYFRFEH